LEDVLTQFVERRKDKGIVNGCALLVHAPTREVLAYAGSAAFLNTTIQGQVDGITARRSPGSALKPFVYALAMDQGLIHPRSLVRDGRIDYADYSPENFDREFTGPITATEALQRSRNIPAITLMQRLASPGLHGFLMNAGVQLPKPESFYGLSLALGGAEVSVEEVAALYAMLADDGVARALVFGHSGPEVPQPVGRPEVAAPLHRPDADAPLLSEAARFLTCDMLRLPGSEIAFKTGTSHGFRDAWAAGICGEHVLVVWLGNFNGKGNASLVARETAAPLLMQMFERLQLPKTQRAAPSSVARVELCAVSGQLPGAWCQHRVGSWFMPGVSSVQTCDVHREVLLDAATGLRVARDDGSRALQREVYEFWPPDLLAMFKQAGLPRREPPAWAPGEATDRVASQDRAPRIVSPITQRAYTLSAHDAARQTIPLRADAAAGVKQVFWFAGSRYLGTSAPAESLLWQASAGTWKLQVLDDQGRGAVAELVVEVR
jgi:penicillin-binding protein 1C